jgi:hypothetical protein
MLKKILTPTTVSFLTAALLLATVAFFAASLMFSPNTAGGHDLADNSDIESLTNYMDKDIFLDSTVFAKSYVTLGSDANIGGNVVAGAATTLGANTDVYGTIDSGAATTLGAAVRILKGDVYSGAATTLGANSVVQGGVDSGADTTIGSGSVIYGYNTSLASGLSDIPNANWSVQGQGFWNPSPYSRPDVGELEVAQDYLYHLPPSITDVTPTPNMFSGVTHNIGVDETWLPGVYTIDGSLTVSAEVIITLDNTNAGDFIINVRDYVSFGELTKVVWKEANTDNSRVIWNVQDTYISLGAQAEIEGMLLAKTYIATGAGSKVTGGVYSAASYVSVGAEAKVGTSTTQTGTSEPEPPTPPFGGGAPGGPSM